MSLLLSRVGAAPPAAVWVPLTATPRPTRVTIRSASTWIGVFDTPPAATATWVPSQPAARAATPAKPGQPAAAFPFTNPAWAPPAPRATTPAAPPAPSSRVVFIGADTPAIAADLPPWMQSADLAARIARPANPSTSMFFLVAPPPTPAGGDDVPRHVYRRHQHHEEEPARAITDDEVIVALLTT